MRSPEVTVPSKYFSLAIMLFLLVDIFVSKTHVVLNDLFSNLWNLFQKFSSNLVEFASLSQNSLHLIISSNWVIYIQGQVKMSNKTSKLVRYGYRRVDYMKLVQKVNQSVYDAGFYRISYFYPIPFNRIHWLHVILNPQGSTWEANHSCSKDIMSIVNTPLW